uniref:Uncharacterized protein n=1 Tax=Pelusios castaneus TaxID=367368 RepID=A0A8C8SPQ1_9SAUR
MEGPRPVRLAAACCLLAGLLLPLPGDGQETLTGQPTTMPVSQPLSEAGGFSPKATAPPVTGTDEDVATPQPSASSARPVQPDTSSTPPDPRTTTEAVTLLPPATALATHAETGLPSEKPSANVSSELPPLDAAVNTTEANQPGPKGTEPSSNTGATAGVSTLPSLEDSLATTRSSQLESSAFSTLGPTTGSPEPTTGSPEPMPQATHGNTTEQRIPGPTTMAAGSTPANTTPSTTMVTLRATSTKRATATAVVRPSAGPVREKPAVLDVGDDDGQDPPSSAVASPMGADPLVLGVVSVFVVMVGILALVGFLRYRQRNSRMEFRRLQDLPMDDMMEDTPLSLYSY